MKTKTSKSVKIMAWLQRRYTKELAKYTTRMERLMGRAIRLGVDSDTLCQCVLNASNSTLSDIGTFSYNDKTNVVTAKLKED